MLRMCVMLISTDWKSICQMTYRYMFSLTVVCFPPMKLSQHHPFSAHWPGSTHHEFTLSFEGVDRVGQDLSRVGTAPPGGLHDGVIQQAFQIDGVLHHWSAFMAAQTGETQTGEFSTAFSGKGVVAPASRGFLSIKLLELLNNFYGKTLLQRLELGKVTYLCSSHRFYIQTSFTD